MLDATLIDNIFQAFLFTSVVIVTKTRSTHLKVNIGANLLLINELKL